jgi:DNA-binding transcriptional LysR family regulator
MDLSLGKLQQVIAVARCGSFSRAAEELHMTQPALSRSIAAIERRFGFPIFNRIGHGVEPTAAAVQVLSQAEVLLQSMRVFDSNMALLAGGKAGTLKMGFPPLLASQALTQMAREFFTGSGEIEVRVSIRSGPALLEELKNDAIEMFLFVEGQIDPGPDIELETVGVIHPTCVVRRNHPLAVRGGLTIADLGKYPWASSVEPPAMGKLLNPSRFICDNYHILRETVLSTDLVCICTRAFVAAELSDGRLQALDISGFLPSKSTIYMATLKGRVLSPLAKIAAQRIAAILLRSDIGSSQSAQRARKSVR